MTASQGSAGLPAASEAPEPLKGSTSTEQFKTQTKRLLEVTACGCLAGGKKKNLKALNTFCTYFVVL